MQRFGQFIGIKPEHIQKYEQLHADVWPDVLAMIRECHIQNYSIFRHENTLFAYFDYVGEDFAADMAKWGKTQKPSSGGIFVNRYKSQWQLASPTSGGSR